MASSAAALKVAAVVAVFAVLVMSSQGHKKTGPLCNDCSSQCGNNCTIYATGFCRQYCEAPGGPGCQNCRDQVLQGCRDCCSNGTCSCDCESTVDVENSCRPACEPRYGSCQPCKNGIFETCFPTCNSDCEKICVKKDHGC